MVIRTAKEDDVEALAALVNEAFRVEAFFKIGDRTGAAEIAGLMQQGEFLVAVAAGGLIAGCVYVTCRADQGYFGMLSIAPALQGQGLGRLLVGAAERRAAALGCRRMDIHIVNLREELPGYYQRLGYVQSGTLPFSHPERASQPCHFVVMTKLLHGR